MTNKYFANFIKWKERKSDIMELDKFKIVESRITFLLKSPDLKDGKYISSKMVKMMLNKLLED